MHYTPAEVAKLLANRPNQPHYIASLIAECVAAERERCCAILKMREGLIAAEAEKAAVSDPDEVSALRAMAWQLTVVEREIHGA